MSEFEEGVFGGYHDDLEVDVQSSMFDIDSGWDDVGDVLEQREQGGVHTKVINEYARLTTVLVEGDSGEVFHVEGLVLQKDVAGSSGLPAVGGSNDDVTSFLGERLELMGHLTIDQKRVLVLTNET